MKGKAPNADVVLPRLARAVFKRRQAAALTQEDVAYEAGVSLRTYQKLESGALNPGYLTLFIVARALHVRLSILIAEAE